MPWLSRHLGLGCALGFVLGVGGETWLVHSTGGDASGARHVLGALSVASGFASALPLTAWLGMRLTRDVPLATHPERWANRVTAALGALLCGVHLAALLAYPALGRYPTLRDAFGWAMHSRDALGFGLGLASLVACGGVALERALRRDAAPQLDTLRVPLFVSAPLLLHVGCLGLGLMLYGQAYLCATPESTLLAGLLDRCAP